MADEKKLKIAYLIPRFYPFKGGAEINCYALATRMAKLGHDVTIVTTDVKFRNEELLAEEFIEGVRIIRLKASTDALYLGFYPGLLSYLFKNRFDLIHSHGIGFVWREFCLILLKLFGRRKTKYIVTPHGPFMAATDNNEGNKGKVKRFGTIYIRLYLNWIYDRIIQVTPNQSEWMKSKYFINEDKVRLVPNGIADEMIEKKIHEHTPEDKVVISFIGRMEYYKGIQDLIMASSFLKRAKFKHRAEEEEKVIPDFEVKILGRAGNYTDKLKTQIEDLNALDYVELIYSPADEIRDQILYEESQINVLPSKWEATGIVLLEAMAKGNVIVSSKQNQALEIIIEEGVNGFSYNFGDEEALAEILYNLLTNYELRQSMRIENLKRAKNFTWSGVMPKYIEVVNELY